MEFKLVNVEFYSLEWGNIFFKEGDFNWFNFNGVDVQSLLIEYSLNEVSFFWLFLIDLLDKF